MKENLKIVATFVSMFGVFSSILPVNATENCSADENDTKKKVTLETVSDKSWKHPQSVNSYSTLTVTRNGNVKSQGVWPLTGRHVSSDRDCLSKAFTLVHGHPGTASVLCWDGNDRLRGSFSCTYKPLKEVMEPFCTGKVFHYD